MRIEIEKKPIITAELDFIAFKRNLRENFDLDNAVKNNLTLKMISDRAKNSAEETIKDLIYMSINWGRVIMHAKQYGNDKVEIYVSSVDVYGMRRYKPDVFDGKTGVATFKEDDSDFQTFLIAHTFMPMLEHHIETMLAEHVFCYANEKWKQVLHLD